MELLKRVLTAVVLIPVVLALVLRAPVAVVAIVTGVVAVAALHELLKLSEAYGIQPLRLPAYIYCALFFILLGIHPGTSDLLSTSAFTYFGLSSAVLAPFVFLSIAMSRDQLASAFPAALVPGFAFTYVALPMASLVGLREQWQGSFLVLYLLVLVWAGDIFAYFIGKPFGRHRMSPRVSPNKTWEGAVASVIASVAVGVVVFHHAPQISRALLQAHLIDQQGGVFQQLPLAPIVLLSIVLNIASQFGDLVESLIKRGAAVKDSGTLLPGHGGMLDRIDALLFAAPVLWIYSAWRVMMQ